MLLNCKKTLDSRRKTPTILLLQVCVKNVWKAVGAIRANRSSITYEPLRKHARIASVKSPVLIALFKPVNPTKDSALANLTETAGDS